MNSRVIYSVVFFILLLILLYTSKSSIMFEKDGKEIKKFGLGHDQTLFSFGIFTIVLAIASFYLFCIIDLVFGSSNVFKAPQSRHFANTQYMIQKPMPAPPPMPVVTSSPQYIESDIYKNF